MLKTAIPTNLWQLSAATGGTEQLGLMAAPQNTAWGSQEPSVFHDPEPGLAAASQQEEQMAATHPGPVSLPFPVWSAPSPAGSQGAEDSLHRQSPAGPTQGHIPPAQRAETMQVWPRASSPAPGWAVPPQQPWPTQLIPLQLLMNHGLLQGQD